MAKKRTRIVPVRIRRNVVTEQKKLLGIKSDGALARLCDMSPQQLCHVLAYSETQMRSISFGVIATLCQALSTTLEILVATRKVTLKPRKDRLEEAQH